MNKLGRFIVKKLVSMARSLVVRNVPTHIVSKKSQTKLLNTIDVGWCRFTTSEWGHIVSVIVWGDTLLRMYLSYHFDELNISVNKMSFNWSFRFKLYISIIFLKPVSQSIFLSNTHCV